MKVVLNIMIGLMVWGTGAIMGETKTTQEKIVRVESVLLESTDNFHISNGEIGVEFTDGSWASVNVENNHYEFQPVDLGDWSYEFDNQEQFENCIKTYLELKNN